MPYSRRQTISWMAGHYFHIYNRGVQKATLFREEENYLYVLRKIRLYCQKFQHTLIAYCLMPNHYHFLVRQDSESPAGLLPQRVFNAYSKAYNKRYNQSGTRFERRYHVKWIDSNAYLLQLCRYIHANPVKDGLVADPKDWVFSNYLDWIGQREGKLVDRDFIKAYFKTADSYREFVFDYLETRSLPEDVLHYLNSLENG